MIKLFIGFLVIVFGLSVFPVNAAIISPVGEKAAGTATFDSRMSLPDNYHALIINIPLSIYGAGTTEDGYPFVVTNSFDQISIRLVGEGYDSGEIEAELTRTGGYEPSDPPVGIYSRILRQGTYSYTISARRSVFYNERLESSSNVSISGSFTLNSSSTIDINWFEGDYDTSPTTTTPLNSFEMKTPLSTTTSTTRIMFDYRRFR